MIEREPARKSDGYLKANWLRSGIINCLRQAAGGIVSKREIVAWVYGDDPNGGPADTQIIDVGVMELRDLGYQIKTHWGRGYSYFWTQWEVTP